VLVLNWSARKLSRLRRRRTAGLAVVLFALLGTGTGYAAIGPVQAREGVVMSEQLDQGRELYLTGCSTCHGLNGEGVRTADGQLGPSLVGVGAAATDFQVGTGRMPLAEPGAQSEPKESEYSEADREAIAAYIATLGPGPEIPGSELYSTADLSEEELEEAESRGFEIFFTNCTACHNFAGAGGAMPRGGRAPALRDTEAKYIVEALITGPGQMPNFSDGNLSPDDKLAVVAYIESIREDTEYGGFGLGGYGPVAEGLMTWIIGIGVAVAFAVMIAVNTTRSKSPVRRARELKHER
jgi:ubiquinol-cytochrome c reductase cytochrome c subunit